MKEYILGYMMPEWDVLVEFSSRWEAEKNAEEWAVVKANSRKEAEEKYEEIFLRWQKSQGLYMGE